VADRGVENTDGMRSGRLLNAVLVGRDGRAVAGDDPMRPGRRVAVKRGRVQRRAAVPCAQVRLTGRIVNLLVPSARVGAQDRPSARDGT